ncbi:hypothetical protein ACFLWU_04360 [Chloroflexota bacterium]
MERFRLYRLAIVLIICSLLVLPACSDSSPESVSIPPQVPEPEADESAAVAEGTSFTISDLLITPSETKIRDKVGISVLVANNGDETGTYEVVLEINGRHVASQQVTLAAGVSETIKFPTKQETQGDYQVNINGLTGIFSVIPPPEVPSKPPPDGKTDDTKPPPKETQLPGRPGRPLPEITPDEHFDWTIPAGSGEKYRAVHMGGNWGTNRDASKYLPEEYFFYLRDLNVNWVGISVALHLDGSMDSTVELDNNEHLPTPTFRDDVLRELISTFRSHGFNVYIHIAIDSGMGGEYPVQRWQLGDPYMHNEDPNISPDAWPWRTDHPQHQSFVAEFWQTHTDSLVHIARIAEEEGAGILTLGTEMNRLYRSRSDNDRWPNHFLNEMQAMVSAVRDVYHGKLGYEMHYGALLDRELFGPGSDYIHDDLDLDFIAVSVYLPLMESVPHDVPTVGELEAIWDSIFNQHLKPLQERNGNRPIVFTEFGYTDSMQALLQGDNDSFVDKIFKDKDGNGLDDGEEVQANIYAAFFNTMDRYPGLLSGAFLWDVMMDTEENYQAGFAKLRTMNIRGKLAEEVVQEHYADWL